APTAFVDMYRLGFSDYVLYFSSTSAAPLEYLLKNPRVTWVSELSGSSQYGAALFVRHVHEFVAFLDDLSRRFGDAITQKSVRLTRTFTRFNRAYLAPDAPRAALSFGLSPAFETIGETDDRLLFALANGAASVRRAAL